MKYFDIYPLSATESISAFGKLIKPKLNAHTKNIPKEINPLTLFVLKAPAKTKIPVNKNTCTMVGKKTDKASTMENILSILKIKQSKAKDQKLKKHLGKQIRILIEEINEAISYKLTKEIYCSKFYMDLFDANLNIFESVDKFKDSEPAQLNMKRIDAKRIIQKRFFGEPLGEIKL